MGFQHRCPLQERITTMKLRQFGVERHTGSLYYSFVESLLAFSVIAWYFSLSAVDENKLNKL